MTFRSAAPVLIQALVDVCTAAPTLGAASPPVAVNYAVRNSADAPRKSLWIAAGDPAEADPVTGVTSTQQWVGLGARNRDEQITVRCYAMVWSGDEGIPAAIGDAYDVVAEVEAITGADPSAGGSLNGFTQPGVTNLELKFGQSDKGPIVFVLFDFIVFARLTAS